MNKFAVAAIIPFFAAYLWSQPQQTKAQSGKSATTTWRGTLVNSGCNPSTNNRTSYPAPKSATSFQLITENGRCIPFDLNSNEKVSGVLKINTDWSENAVKIAPTKVEVVGTENGGAISVDDIEFVKRPSPVHPGTPDAPSRE